MLVMSNATANQLQIFCECFEAQNFEALVLNLTLVITGYNIPPDFKMSLVCYLQQSGGRFRGGDGIEFINY